MASVWGRDVYYPLRFRKELSGRGLPVRLFMFLGNFSGLVPTSFKYPWYDEEGKKYEAVIKIGVARLSMTDVLSKELQDALAVAADDPKPIAQLLAGRTQDDCTDGQTPRSALIGSWNLFVDKEETVPFEITWQNIASRPMDFVSQLAETAIEVLIPNPPKAGS